MGASNANAARRQRARALAELRQLYNAGRIRPARQAEEVLVTEEERDQTTLHLRVRWPVIEQLDALADELAADVLTTPGARPSRAEVARMAMAEGVRVMRARYAREARAKEKATQQLDMNLDTWMAGIQRDMHWLNVCAALRDAHAPLAAVCTFGKVLAWADGRVVVALPEAYMHLATDARHVEAIEAAIQQRHGAEWRLDVVLAE